MASADQASCNTLVVLGSGGHTAEMLRLLETLDATYYSPRSYIVAATDRMGAQHALASEQRRPSYKDGADVRIIRLPRSREVGQSYLTSIWTTIVAFFAALSIIRRQRPDLVLVNGPGTCIPVCFAVWLFRGLGLCKGKIVLIESIARVKSLSLSGKILYRLHMADALLVQWSELQRLYPRTVHRGRLY